MDIRKISYLGWLWPLGFLGFYEPILFGLFAFGPIGTGLAYYLTSKFGGKVTSIGCCCGVIIRDESSKSYNRI
jgi:hypothetical protein